MGIHSGFHGLHEVLLVIDGTLVFNLIKYVVRYSSL